MGDGSLAHVEEQLCRHKPVADPRFRQEVLGPVRVGLELLSKVPHADPKVFRVFRVGWSPNIPQELTIRNNLSGICGQNYEQSILDGG